MAEEKFHLVSSYAPTGDQPQAIAQLVEGVERGDRCQTLLGDRKSTRLNSSHANESRMPSSA